MKTPYQKLVHDLDKDHASALIVFKLLNKHGFRKLGEGMYSATFGKKDEPYVVKVNFRPDPASFKFYSMIVEKKSSYFPRIHKLKSFVTNDGSFLFFVVMERLKHVTGRTWAKANKGGIGFACWLACHPQAMMDIPLDYVDYEETGLSWERQNQSSANTVLSILEATSNFGGVDFHDDNLMVRLPSGDVVLTDPVCSFDE